MVIHVLDDLGYPSWLRTPPFVHIFLTSLPRAQLIEPAPSFLLDPLGPDQGLSLGYQVPFKESHPSSLPFFSEMARKRKPHIHPWFLSSWWASGLAARIALMNFIGSFRFLALQWRSRIWSSAKPRWLCEPVGHTALRRGRSCFSPGSKRRPALHRNFRRW